MSRLTDTEEVANYIECPSCLGTGQYDIGDCEDGVTESCPECEGYGDVETGDMFIPERDGLTPND